MKLMKKTAVLFAVLFVFVLVSCAGGSVSYENGSVKFLNVLIKLKEKDSLDENQNFNFCLDTVNKKYLAEYKRILTTLEYTHSFSFYNNQDLTTAVSYTYEKNYTGESFVINSDKYTYGLAGSLGYYVFNEKSLKSKTDNNRQENTIFRKHYLGDEFFNVIKSEKENNYYYNYVKSILGYWTDNSDDLNLEKGVFTKEKGIYTLKISSTVTLQDKKTAKEMTVTFDEDNIFFIETVIKVFDLNNELQDYSWNKLVIKMQSGRAVVPSDTEIFENY